MIVEVALVGFAYIVYREYKSGKLNTFVSNLEARVTALEAAAKAEVANIGTAVVADVKKVL